MDGDIARHRRTERSPLWLVRHGARPETLRAHPVREPRVQAIGRQSQRAPDGAPVHYERHRPEQTTLYRLVPWCSSAPPAFIAHTEASTGSALPRFIKDEFDAFLECGSAAS